MTEEKKKQATGTEGEGKEELSVEESFRLLEEMAEKMEDPDTTLEESFHLYQKGMELLKQVNGILDTYEKKMQILSSGGMSEPEPGESVLSWEDGSGYEIPFT